MMALAGLVPCAEAGISTTSRCACPSRVVMRANDLEAGELALRAGVRLQRHGGKAGDRAERRRQLVARPADSPASWSAGANGWIRENSGHDTGYISLAAFSFIVHEPSGIIDVSSPMSFRSRLFM